MSTHRMLLMALFLIALFISACGGSEPGQTTINQSDQEATTGEKVVSVPTPTPTQTTTQATPCAENSHKGGHDLYWFQEQFAIVHGYQRLIKLASEDSQAGIACLEKVVTEYKQAAAEIKAQSPHLLRDSDFPEDLKPDGEATEMVIPTSYPGAYMTAPPIEWFKQRLVDIDTMESELEKITPKLDLKQMLQAQIKLDNFQREYNIEAGKIPANLETNNLYLYLPW